METSPSESTDKINAGKCKQKHLDNVPGAVARDRSDARPSSMRTVAGSILTSANIL